MRRPPARWDLWLPAAAVVVAALLTLLAGSTERASRQRDALALEGALFRVAHEVEVDLREEGPGAARAVLERHLETSRTLIRGLELVGVDGAVEVAVGAPGAPAEGAARRVDLFLGPAWRGAGGPGGGPGSGSGVGPESGPGRGGLPGFGGGRRELRLAPAAEAARRPWSQVLLMPTVALVAVALVLLAGACGRLLVRRQREERDAAERQSLEALARAGAGLAHQLRTPLATVKGSCQLLMEEGGPLAGDRRLAAVLEQSERMDRLLGELLDYARPARPEPAELSVAEAIGELAGQEPGLRLVTGGELRVRADPEHLHQILGNLVANAREASPEGAPVEVSARRRSEGIEIRIADRGPGPGPEPEGLFEPYLTTRADGTGLGLPIARSLARANGGEVELGAGPTGGGVARVLLPAGEGPS